ncbi:hypothetical protein CEXT_671101 [Caerostris extrusa]|uniref:Uncharacterized protein n=1 Tax=Caerostris extrusa TaxID=172846 RepID=A0AAV4PFY1_CAEEX|nr:hypothetical protein CEXT_671101 [Caerostris extrusa]
MPILVARLLSSPALSPFNVSPEDALISQLTLLHVTCLLLFGFANHTNHPFALDIFLARSLCSGRGRLMTTVLQSIIPSKEYKEADGLQPSLFRGGCHFSVRERGACPSWGTRDIEFNY